jgi:hypothetical protein
MLASLGVFVEWMFEVFGGHRKEASHRFEDNGRRNSKKILLLHNGCIRRLKELSRKN